MDLAEIKDHTAVYSFSVTILDLDLDGYGSGELGKERSMFLVSLKFPQETLRNSQPKSSIFVP